MSPDSNKQARAFHEQAIALDPGFALAYSGLAWAHFNDANFYWSDSREGSTQKALKAANQALRLDPNPPDAYSVLGMIHSLLLADHDPAVAYGKKAVELQPNGAQASAVLGILLTLSGEPEAARRYLEKAVALNPFPEPWYDFELGKANQLTGRLDKAIEHFEAAISKTPKWVLLRLHAAYAYVEAGRMQDAQREIEAALQLEPGTSIEKADQFENWKRLEDRDRYLGNLRKAGLK
ncbi:MAG: tetratricopeptide repeat protein [Betaproteobacteria bacterium]|nr:tetratricopeptide repeat protein [Betaproteobacteria bacterium]